MDKKLVRKETPVVGYTATFKKIVSADSNDSALKEEEEHDFTDGDPKGKLYFWKPIFIWVFAFMKF